LGKKCRTTHNRTVQSFRSFSPSGSSEAYIPVYSYKSISWKPVQSGAPHLTTLPTLQVSPALEARAVGSYFSPDGLHRFNSPAQQKSIRLNIPSNYNEHQQRVPDTYSRQIQSLFLHSAENFYAVEQQNYFLPHDNPFFGRQYVPRQRTPHDFCRFCLVAVILRGNTRCFPRRFRLPRRAFLPLHHHTQRPHRPTQRLHRLFEQVRSSFWFVR